jgi:maleylacetoacetate isomerase
MKLFTFWRSLATFRVRIALNLKGIEVEPVYVDLLKGHQREDAYRAVNPLMVIPALDDGKGPPLFESLAIIEYLDETQPQPPLLPKEPRARARVRALSQIVACDAHPLIVPRVRNYLQNELKIDEAARLKWVRHWFVEGYKALESHLARDPATARYCQGDTVSMADLCLVSHTVGGQFFDLESAPYPTVHRIAEACLKEDAFARAHPLKQPGAPAGFKH